MISPELVTERLAALRRRIADVERAHTHPVEVVAVTKGFDGSAVDAAVAAGARSIGENYAQDLLSKRDTIEALDVEVRFIGHLQSNKVRQVAPLVTVWETVDRASLVTEIARRAPGARVLVQVNSTDEDAKSGCRPADVADLVDRARDAGLVVEGLMTIGPTDAPPEAARAPFLRTRELVDELGLATCSMGMSADIEIAVACGSTEVRVGTGLFGARPPR